MAASTPEVVLFGYDSSPFTQKVQLSLLLKQIPYTYVVVPSMMPRPVLRDFFHLTYRKIPVLSIGTDVYCDTSMILEALEHIFTGPYPTLYPRGPDNRDNRALIRGFASYWTDLLTDTGVKRPLFRVATGLIPGAVWRTSFGEDRARLIGHKIDAKKIEAKIPESLCSLDLQLSILEPQLANGDWFFSTQRPSLADISLYYQLNWANRISAGEGVSDLTGGSIRDIDTSGIEEVFNADRYPNILTWFQKFKKFMDLLPSTQTRLLAEDVDQTLREFLLASPQRIAPDLLPTSAPPNRMLNQKLGLNLGTEVSVAPDDTGRDDPTHGTLKAISPEEVVISPNQLYSAPALLADIKLHFPRLGFVVRPKPLAKL